jgi:uncharacterized RDD family membrane protein YckC
MTTGPEAGYYADPSVPGYIRYWDGTRWVPGTSQPAGGLLEQQQELERQYSPQQAAATQPAVSPEPPRLEPPRPQPPQPDPSRPDPAPAPADHQEPDDLSAQNSVATMIVPSAYGGRGGYARGSGHGVGAGPGADDSPFASIPGLYRNAEPEEAPAPEVRVVELASPGSRMLARIIDLCIATVLSAPATATLLLIAHKHDHAYVDRLRLHATTTYRTLGLDGLGITLWAAAAAAVLLTAAGLEAYRLPRTGQTAGRRLVGVRVVAAGAADEVSWGAALARAMLFCLFAIVPLLDLAALGGILWGRPYRQGLHEKMSRTLSIRAENTSA